MAHDVVLDNGSNLFPGPGWVTPGTDQPWNILALDGNDTVAGSPLADTIDGGNGNDNLFGHSGNDTIYGWNGNDRLDGDTGNDQLWGEAGNDTLYGGTTSGSGDDLLFGGGGGVDFLYGADGNDQYYHDVGWGGVSFIKESAGTSDVVVMWGVSSINDLGFFKVGNNDLFIMTNSDAADGVNDDGVVINGWFSNTGAPSPVFEVEYLSVAGTTYDLSVLLTGA